MRLIRVLFLSFLFFSSLTHAQDSLNVTDENGLKQGKWKVRHPNGMTRYIGSFEDSKPVGEFKYFAADGSHTKTLDFRGDSAYAKFFHTNGNIMAEGKYFNQQKTGKWKFYDEEGDISLQEIYKNGKRNGPSRVYYKNGEVTRDCSYKNDVLHGMCTDYFKDGQKKFEGNYVDGNLDGKVAHYNPNGTTWQRGVYKASVKDGKWLMFNEKGELLQIEHYKLGDLIKTTQPEQKQDDTQGTN